MRKFNTTGLCVPRKHYMVDISDRVAQIKAMVDEGDYFCMNRGRQYGKTTTIFALEGALASQYEVVSLDFQALSHGDFRTEASFVVAFCLTVLRECSIELLPTQISAQMKRIVQKRKEDWLLDDL